MKVTIGNKKIQSIKRIIPEGKYRYKPVNETEDAFVATVWWILGLYVDKVH